MVLGGYTERRIAVNTDTIGTRVEREDDFARLTAPPAPAQVDDYLRTFGVFGSTLTAGQPKAHDIYWPDLVAHAEDPVTGNRYPAVGEGRGDAKGRDRYTRRAPGHSGGHQVFARRWSDIPRLLQREHAFSCNHEVHR